MMASMQMRFPALKGKMGARTYYVAMFPLGVIPKLFSFTDWAEMPPEIRAQRKLVAKRVPEIAQYILDHEDDWIFSSLTASFTADETFKASEFDANLGVLELPLDAAFLINDGQHRRAAIESALRANKTLESQTISVVLFPEENLERNQQMFSDLNRTVQKTSRSLDILYDHRDPMNQITLAVADAVPIFHGRVEKDAVSLAMRSPKLVTLSALYDANGQLLGAVGESQPESEISARENQAIEYWKAVTESIPEWRSLRDGDLKPSEARTEYVHVHAVAFWALGTAGRELIRRLPKDWESRLGSLAEIDWHKSNPDWQGIAMLGPDIVTRRQTRDAMSKYIQWKLGLGSERPRPVLEIPAGRLGVR